MLMKANRSLGDSDPVMARQLVRTCRSAALASALPGKRSGWPYASLVTVACDVDASPILLLSGLADHSRNLAIDDRACLLFEAASGRPNPQTGPRVSLTGRLQVAKNENLACRFLARHPGAKRYAGFGDFAFYRMAVDRAHYVGGFGRAKWFGAARFLFEQEISRDVAMAENDIVENLNEKHPGNVASVARKLFGSSGKIWETTAVDPEGCDFRCRNTFRRHNFDEPAVSVGDLREKIANLVENL